MELNVGEPGRFVIIKRKVCFCDTFVVVCVIVCNADSFVSKIAQNTMQLVDDLIWMSPINVR